MRTYDGMTTFTIPQVRQIIANTLLDGGNRRYRLIDVSGGSAQGYDFNLVEQVKFLDDFTDENGNVLFREWAWKNSRVVASSHDTHRPHARNVIGGIGAYGPTFDRSEIAEVL